MEKKSFKNSPLKISLTNQNFKPQKKFNDGWGA